MAREDLSEALERLRQVMARLADLVDRQGASALGPEGGQAGPDAFGVVSLGKGQGYGTLDQTGEKFSGSYFSERKAADAFAAAHRRMFDRIAARAAPPTPSPTSTSPPTPANRPAGTATPATMPVARSAPPAVPDLDRLGRMIGAALGRQLGSRAAFPTPGQSSGGGRRPVGPTDPPAGYPGWARPVDPSAPRPMSAHAWRQRMDAMGRAAAPGRVLAPLSGGGAGGSGPPVPYPAPSAGAGGPLGSYHRPIDVAGAPIRVRVPSFKGGAAGRRGRFGRYASFFAARARAAASARFGVAAHPSARRVAAFGRGAARTSRVLGRMAQAAGTVAQGVGAGANAAGLAAGALGMGARVAGGLAAFAGPAAPVGAAVAGVAQLGAAAIGAVARIAGFAAKVGEAGAKVVDLVVKLRNFGEQQNQSNRWAAAYNRRTSAAFQELDRSQHWRDVALARDTAGTAATLARSTDRARAAFAPVDTLVQNTMNRAAIFGNGVVGGIGRAIGGPAGRLDQWINGKDPDGTVSYATGVYSAVYGVEWIKSWLGQGDPKRTPKQIADKAFQDALADARKKAGGNTRWETGIHELIRGGPLRGEKLMPRL